jgi:hypothetical protein
MESNMLLEYDVTISSRMNLFSRFIASMTWFQPCDVLSLTVKILSRLLNAAHSTLIHRLSALGSTQRTKQLARTYLSFHSSLNVGLLIRTSRLSFLRDPHH